MADIVIKNTNVLASKGTTFQPRRTTKHTKKKNKKKLFVIFVIFVFFVAKNSVSLCARLCVLVTITGRIY